MWIKSNRSLITVVYEIYNVTKVTRDLSYTT